MLPESLCSSSTPPYFCTKHWWVPGGGRGVAVGLTCNKGNVKEERRGCRSEKELACHVSSFPEMTYSRVAFICRPCMYPWDKCWAADVKGYPIHRQDGVSVVRKMVCRVFSLPEMNDKIPLHSRRSNPSRRETPVFEVTDIAPESLDTCKSGFKLEGAAEVARRFL